MTMRLIEIDDTLTQDVIGHPTSKAINVMAEEQATPTADLTYLMVGGIPQELATQARLRALDRYAALSTEKKESTRVGKFIAEECRRLLAAETNKRREARVDEAIPRATKRRPKPTERKKMAKERKVPSNGKTRSARAVTQTTKSETRVAKRVTKSPKRPISELLQIPNLTTQPSSKTTQVVMVVSDDEYEFEVEWFIDDPNKEELVLVTDHRKGPIGLPMTTFDDSVQLTLVDDDDEVSYYVAGDPTNFRFGIFEFTVFIRLPEGFALNM